MKAELIDLYSTDIPEPLSDFLFNVKDNFGFLVRMIVGEKSLGEKKALTFFYILQTGYYLTIKEMI